jgi:hypothetical protein
MRYMLILIEKNSVVDCVLMHDVFLGFLNMIFIDIVCFSLGVFLESPTEFTVDAKSVTGSGAGRVECLLTSPSGRVVRCPVKNMADGTYQVQYAPYEQGKYPIDKKN